MKNLFLVTVLVSWTGFSYGQDIDEVRAYIEDMISNYQPSTYSYELGYSDEFTKEFLDEFIPEFSGNPASIFISERCNTTFNLCRRNFFNLEGVNRIHIREEQGYVTLRFTIKSGFTTTEFIKALDNGWKEELDPEYPPMILLDKNSIEQAKKIRSAFLFLIKQYGGNPVEEDLF